MLSGPSRACSICQALRNPAEQHLGQLRAELAYAQVANIIGSGLHEFLDAFQTKLNLVGESIFTTFLALRPIGGGVTGNTQSQRSTGGGEQRQV